MELHTNIHVHVHLCINMRLTNWRRLLQSATKFLFSGERVCECVSECANEVRRERRRGKDSVNVHQRHIKSIGRSRMTACSLYVHWLTLRESFTGKCLQLTSYEINL